MVILSMKFRAESSRYPNLPLTFVESSVAASRLKIFFNLRCLMASSGGFYTRGRSRVVGQAAIVGLLDVAKFDPCTRGLDAVFRERGKTRPDNRPDWISGMTNNHNVINPVIKLHFQFILR